MKKVYLSLLAMVLVFANVVFAGQWIQNGDAWMYQDDEGDFVVAEQKRIDGKYYYFDGEGCMLTGLQNINGVYYIFNDDGTPKTDQIVYNGKTYTVTSKGKINNMTAAVFEQLKDNDFITKRGEVSSELTYAQKLVTTFPISKRALRLILENKGISSDKVEYVMANTNLNWKDQAVKCAQKYLTYRNYDKEVLIAILYLEGFTDSEAKYGVEIATVAMSAGTTTENDKIQDMAKYIEEMKYLATLIQ